MPSLEKTSVFHSHSIFWCFHHQVWSQTLRHSCQCQLVNSSWLKQDDVIPGRKLGCPKTSCQESSLVSPLWFLICSFMSSDSEGERINFQSDTKALQEHHYPCLFRNLAQLPAPIPGVIHLGLSEDMGLQAHWPWCLPTECSHGGSVWLLLFPSLWRNWLGPIVMVMQDAENLALREHFLCSSFLVEERWDG